MSVVIEELTIIHSFATLCATGGSLLSRVVISSGAFDLLTVNAVEIVKCVDCYFYSVRNKVVSLSPVHTGVQGH